jgi:hypothetical protein
MAGTWAGNFSYAPIIAFSMAGECTGEGGMPHRIFVIGIVRVMAPIQTGAVIKSRPEGGNHPVAALASASRIM